jgi:hypothetical protein
MDIEKYMMSKLTEACDAYEKTICTNVKPVEMSEEERIRISTT